MSKYSKATFHRTITLIYTLIALISLLIHTWELFAGCALLAVVHALFFVAYTQGNQCINNYYNNPPESTTPCVVKEMDIFLHGNQQKEVVH